MGREAGRPTRGRERLALSVLWAVGCAPPPDSAAGGERAARDRRTLRPLQRRAGRRSSGRVAAPARGGDTEGASQVVRRVDTPGHEHEAGGRATIAVIAERVREPAGECGWSRERRRAPPRLTHARTSACAVHVRPSGPALTPSARAGCEQEAPEWAASFGGKTLDINGTRVYHYEYRVNKTDPVEVAVSKLKAQVFGCCCPRHLPRVVSRPRRVAAGAHQRRQYTARGLTKREHVCSCASMAGWLSS